MAGEYPIHTIGELCYVTDGAHAKVERREYGVPYLTSKNIGHGRLLLGKLDFISAEDFERLFANTSRAQRRPKDGDVLIGIIGTFGNAYLYRNSDNFGISSAVALLRPDLGKLDPRFLYFAVTSPTFQGAHAAYKSGSVQGYTNIPTIKRLPLPLPSVPEQRAIAYILGTFDDKIELNREMQETLEAIPRALFKSWFVDFDPVRAKAEGASSALPQRLADLFPDSFEESELGEIPKGWGVISLGQLATIQGGRQLPTEDCHFSGAVPVYGANGIMGYTDQATHEGFIIAFGRVGAYCGSIHWAYGGAWINNNASAVSPTRWPEYVLQALLAIDFDGMRTGSAQPFIPNGSLASSQLLRPPDAVLDAFCSVVRPLRIKQSEAVKESNIISSVRDALLPMLVSGEVRLRP